MHLITWTCICTIVFVFIGENYEHNMKTIDKHLKGLGQASHPAFSDTQPYSGNDWSGQLHTHLYTPYTSYTFISFISSSVTFIVQWYSTLFRSINISLHILYLMTAEAKLHTLPYNNLTIAATTVKLRRNSATSTMLLPPPLLQPLLQLISFPSSSTNWLHSPLIWYYLITNSDQVKSSTRLSCDQLIVTLLPLRTSRGFQRVCYDCCAYN